MADWRKYLPKYHPLYREPQPEIERANEVQALLVPATNHLPLQHAARPFVAQAHRAALRDDKRGLEIGLSNAIRRLDPEQDRAARDYLTRAWGLAFRGRNLPR